MQFPALSQQIPSLHSRLEAHKLPSHGQPIDPTTQKLEPSPAPVPSPVALPAPVPLAFPAELPMPPFAPPAPLEVVPDVPVELLPEQAAARITNAAQNFEACRM